MTKIKYINGQTQMAIIDGNQQSDLVSRGLDAQYNYDYPTDFHIWQTSYGFEKDADTRNPKNAERKALSVWLETQNIKKSQMVLIEFCEFLYHQED